jgi:hypothetical protein
MNSLRRLGRYVEIMCKNDMPTFLSSGFEAASTTRTAAPPLPPASILKVDHGNSGELLVTIKSLPRARSYDVRYAPAPAGGSTPATWTTAFCQRKNSRTHWRPDAGHQLPLPGSRFRQAGPHRLE